MAESHNDRARNNSKLIDTIAFALPPAQIALFKAIVESYDNLATVRTEDPQLHHMKLYFAPEMRLEIEALLEALAADFSITRLDSP
jgi:hypothetical protein